MKKLIYLALLSALSIFYLACCNNVQKCCNNGKQNRGEEQVDCGGKCPDCPTCSDGDQNGQEEGVDCGGPECDPCPTCDDGDQNGNEEGIDCGGDCPPCINLCDNGVLDPGETQVDCGGDCGTCTPRDPVIGKELMITDLRVIDSQEARTGAFSIGHLIRNMAASTSADDVKAFVLSLLKSWETDQQVANFTVPRRTAIRQLVINPWKILDHGNSDISDADWVMNLDNAPFRLMAIVNRVDLHKLDESTAEAEDLERTGEGRFVYCIVDPGTGNPREFTVIFEYNLPGGTLEELELWTKRWHHLGTLGDFDAGYIDALKLITEDFAGRNKIPSAPNGNALAQIRTNEIALDGPWELREFNIDRGTGLLKEVSRKQTPDIGFNNTSKLARFINSVGAIIDDASQTHEVPNNFEGESFIAGNVPTPGLRFEWSAPGISSSRLSTFSLETCNGCHGGSANTRPVNPTARVSAAGLGFTSFTHIKPRFENERTVLSEFLAGTGNNDLQRRSETMQVLMDELPATADADAILAFIKARGNRTH